MFTSWRKKKGKSKKLKKPKSVLDKKNELSKKRKKECRWKLKPFGSNDVWEE